MALRAYKTSYGSLPKGDDRAIARALCGENPSKFRFLVFEEAAFSPGGELLDPRGTPYQLEITGNQIVIRSAGPNGRFDDSDDKRLEDYHRVSDCRTRRYRQGKTVSMPRVVALRRALQGDANSRTIRSLETTI